MLSDGHVVFVDTCELKVGTRPWLFARDHAAAIDAHWAKRSAETPQFFNGQVLMIADYVIDGPTLRAEFFKTDFKSFLYWRETGEKSGVGIVDGFGSALIKSRDGAVLLGKQKPGNINSGLAYLPGGFVDKRDVREYNGGSIIDIRASIRREIAEETGLAIADLAEQPGFIVTLRPAQLSIAVEFVSPLSASDLRNKMLAHIRAETDPELADVVIVRTVNDLVDLPTPPYAKVLLNRLFTGDAS